MRYSRVVERAENVDYVDSVDSESVDYVDHVDSKSVDYVDYVDCAVMI